MRLLNWWRNRPTLDDKLAAESERTGRSHRVWWDHEAHEWRVRTGGLAGYSTAHSEREAKRTALAYLRMTPVRFKDDAPLLPPVRPNRSEEGRT